MSYSANTLFGNDRDEHNAQPSLQIKGSLARSSLIKGYHY